MESNPLGLELKCSLHSICTPLNKLLDFLIPSCKMADPIKYCSEEYIWDTTLKVSLFQRGSSVQFSTGAQSCLTLCDPMNHSTPNLLVHHQLPKFTQTHVHWARDAIQLSHPLSPLLLWIQKEHPNHTHNCSAPLAMDATLDSGPWD